MNHRFLAPALSLTFILTAIARAQTTNESFPVTLSVDAAQFKGPMKPIYRFFGADEPNYATMPDGLKLLHDIGHLGPAQAFFRAHSLMNTGDGTPALKWGSTNMYTEDAQGNGVYDYTIVDNIFDAYLKNNVKPYVEIGFMPKALSSHPEPYQHTWAPGQPYNNIYTGWSYPPKDYAKWGDVVYHWAKHCVDKYGAEEVNQWYWEVWNESNGGYWKGTPQDFWKLHDYAIDGVRRALPTAKVGGPDAAGSGGAWTRNFLEHCLRGTNYATGKIGTPIDFVSFHAKGSPTFVDNHVRTGISNQLRTMDDGFGIVASYPELKSKPIVIGESDPDGCAACTGPQLGYRNTTMYSSYTAACYGRELDLADRRGVNLEGALTWAFEFENTPIFGGYREMSTTGDINLPVFNVFRMLGKMGGRRVVTTSSSAVALDDIIRSGVRAGKPDVSAEAALDGNRLCIFTWHYYDDDMPGPAADVTLNLSHISPLAKNVTLTEYRVDQTHSNAFTLWEKWGQPRNPTAAQMKELEAAAQLQSAIENQPLTVIDGTATVHIALPRQAVSLLVLNWE